MTRMRSLRSLLITAGVVAVAAACTPNAAAGPIKLCANSITISQFDCAGNLIDCTITCAGKVCVPNAPHLAAVMDACCDLGYLECNQIIACALTQGAWSCVADCANC